jgi:hypothetical protein
MEAMLYVMNQLPPKVRNLKGQQFGRLTARKFIELKHDGAVWECDCSCGNITTVRAGDLKSKNTKSCLIEHECHQVRNNTVFDSILHLY